MLNVLPQDPIPYRRSQLGGAAFEALDGALDSGFCAHGIPIQQTCLQCIRKLACAQGVQNLLRMKSIGDQVREYREANGLSTAQLAQKVEKQRQHIEQLEKAGNRIPKYLGDLAAVMGTTADEMLALAGLAKSKPEKAAPSSSFAPLQPLSLDEAIEKIAEVLASLDEEGRAMASTALSNLARNPMHPEKAARSLANAMTVYPRTPEPETDPDPTPSGRGKRKAPAAEQRQPAKAKLTVTAGGGQKMQLDLPLRKALESKHDPFDERNAPASERLWYKTIKSAPKASGSAKHKDRS